MYYANNNFLIRVTSIIIINYHMTVTNQVWSLMLPSRASALTTTLHNIKHFSQLIPLPHRNLFTSNLPTTTTTTGTTTPTKPSTNNKNNKNYKNKYNNNINNKNNNNINNNNNYNNNNTIRSSSIKGCLPSKVVFHQRSSSI